MTLCLVAVVIDDNRDRVETNVCVKWNFIPASQWAVLRRIGYGCAGHVVTVDDVKGKASFYVWCAVPGFALAGSAWKTSNWLAKLLMSV